MPSAPPGRVQVMARTSGPSDSPYPFARVVVTLEAGKTVDLGDLAALRTRLAKGEQPGDLGFEVKRIGTAPDPVTAQLTVAIVRADASAGKAGLKVGDEIVSVDGDDVRGDPAKFYVLSSVPPRTKLTLGLADRRSIVITAGPPRP